jgi:hypothetical protein
VFTFITGDKYGSETVNFSDGLPKQLKLMYFFTQNLYKLLNIGNTQETKCSGYKSVIVTRSLL